MREIKFRVWDKEDERFAKNSHLVFDFDGNIFNLQTGEDEKELILLQYTGLKDKNKKEIYEGDILRRPAKDAWEKENYECYEVFFHDGNEAGEHIGFVMNRSHYHGNMSGGCIPGFLPRQTEKMEVIGNIYENKELLK